MLHKNRGWKIIPAIDGRIESFKFLPDGRRSGWSVGQMDNAVVKKPTSHLIHKGFMIKLYIPSLRIFNTLGYSWQRRRHNDIKTISDGIQDFEPRFCWLRGRWSRRRRLCSFCESCNYDDHWWWWSGWRIALVESCHPVICEGRTLFDSSSQLTTTYKDLLSPPLVICYLPACYSLSLLLLLIIFSWPHLLMACARDNDIQSQTQLWAQEERQRICHKIDYCEFGPQCVYPGILSNLLFSTYHSDFDRSGVSEKEIWNMWEIKGMEGGAAICALAITNQMAI